MMKVLLIALIGIFFSGCAASYNQQILKSPTSKLERGKGVFISTPKNGWYGKIEYKNSGKMTANTLKAAFSRFSNNIYISEDCFGPKCLRPCQPRSTHIMSNQTFCIGKTEPLNGPAYQIKSK
jgi:Domain of unknown function (DUF4823)